MSGDGFQPRDTMAERDADPTWKHRLSLNANQWLVTAGLMVFVFLGLLVARVSPVSLRALTGRRIRSGRSSRR